MSSASSAHSRQSSVNSAYSLASPISLPSTPASQQHTRSSSRHSFFSRLGKARDRSYSRGHKSNSSEEWEWTCRGEDLEDNFSWPPEGWSDSDTPQTPPLVHSRGSSGSFSRNSQDSFDSPPPITPSHSSWGYAGPSRPDNQKRTSPPLAALPAVVDNAEDDSFMDFMKREPGCHLEKSKRLPPPPMALGPLPPLPAEHQQQSAIAPAFQPALVKPLRLSKSASGSLNMQLSGSSSSGSTSTTVDEDAQRRRKADEELAIEAISTLFKRSSLASYSDPDLPIRPSRLQLGPLPAPPTPSEWSSASASPTIDTVRTLGSPFQHRPSLQQKRPSHHRRPAHAFTMVSGETAHQLRRPSADRPTSLVAVQGEPSEEQRRPSYSSFSTIVENQHHLRPKSSAYYDFI